MTHANPITLPLWPDGVPGLIDTAAADVPRLDVYPAAGGPVSCVLICPGGGYDHRADHEGAPVARWLNTLGIAAAVVHYRVSPYRHPSPIDDLVRAMRIVQTHADEWSVDRERIGVLGFSAGGHLASTLATHFEADVRPALAILLYPVITLGPPSAHTGSRNNLLPDPNDAATVAHLSNEQHVRPDTPPTFVFHTVDDAAVPVENALLYAVALRRQRIPFEMHLYESGRHGVGLATDHPVLSTWPSLCERWLVSRGWVPAVRAAHCDPRHSRRTTSETQSG